MAKKRPLFASALFRLLLVLLGSPSVVSHAADNPAEDILERYRELLIAEAPESPERSREWVQTLTTDGTWTDIDYDSTAKDRWPTRDHLTRALRILQVRASGMLSETEASHFFAAANDALENWAEHRYQSLNWYWNEIGVPRTMADILILLGDEIAPSLRERLLPVVDQFDIHGTSANLVWSAGIGFHYGCLTGNVNLMDSAVRRVWEEITIGQFEGIQYDGSFFQHEERVQNFTYGKGFIAEVVNLAFQLRGSPWEMPEEKQAIINTYLLDGTQWLLQGRKNSPIGIDRAIAQPRAFDARGDFRNILERWIEISSERTEELEAFLAHQNGEGGPLVGFRYFFRGDAAAYHTTEGSIFLKTISDRTHLTESFIGLNFLGWKYLTCGDHYVFRDGEDYENLQPVWRWSNLPGVTTPAYWSEQVPGRFVGGVEFGDGGSATMDYLRTGEFGHVQVRKFWAFHDGMMVCLLGGWDYTTFWGQITTGIEQAHFRAPLTLSKGGEITVVEPGKDVSHAELDVDWVLQNGVGYYFFNPQESRVQAGPYSGDWRRINRDLPLDLKVEPVLAIALEHSHEPKPSGYAVFLGTDVEQMSAIAEDRPWEILRNDSAAQAIRFRDGTIMAVIYEADIATLIDGIQFGRPCVASWKGEKLVIADPTHRGGSVDLSWHGTYMTVELPADGSSIEVTAP